MTALNTRNIKGPRGSCYFCGVSVLEHPENGSWAYRVVNPGTERKECYAGMFPALLPTSTL